MKERLLSVNIYKKKKKKKKKKIKMWLLKDLSRKRPRTCVAEIHEITVCLRNISDNILV